jgi:hypothetical protein
MADDIADLDPEANHGRRRRKLRAEIRQEQAARYVMVLMLEGWRMMPAVRAAMKQCGMKRSAVFAAIKQHRAAIERTATYSVFREWSTRLGIRRILRD